MVGKINVNKTLNKISLILSIGARLLGVSQFHTNHFINSCKDDQDARNLLVILILKDSCLIIL